MEERWVLPALSKGTRSGALLGSALSPDALVELHPVPSFGGVAALLAANAADLAEEFLTVALFRGHTTFASSFGSGHLGSLRLGHPTPSSCGQMNKRARQASMVVATLPRT